MSTPSTPSQTILLNQLHPRQAIFEIIHAKYINNTSNYEQTPCIIANGGLRLDLFNEEAGTLTKIQRFELGFSCARICYLDFVKEIPGNRKSRFFSFVGFDK